MVQACKVEVTVFIPIQFSEVELHGNSYLPSLVLLLLLLVVVGTYNLY